MSVGTEIVAQIAVRESSGGSTVWEHAMHATIRRAADVADGSARGQANKWYTHEQTTGTAAVRDYNLTDGSLTGKYGVFALTSKLKAIILRNKTDESGKDIWLLGHPTEGVQILRPTSAQVAVHGGGVFLWYSPDGVDVADTMDIVRVQPEEGDTVTWEVGFLGV